MINKINRPKWPKRAVITAGMPYGNKSLHIGHIGGVFVQADVYRRFLIDQLGEENVIFVSGTDCYGSPIMEYYRLAQLNDSFEGSIEDYVLHYHEKQKEALEAFNIPTKSFFTSGFYEAGEIHKELSNKILKTLFDKGVVKKYSTYQFYDNEVEKFLNGRQVKGKCPVPNCTSEKGYADECDMGHPYEPNELIDPISMLSNTKPELKEVANWYIDLNDFRNELDAMVEAIQKDQRYSKNTKSIVKEFLEPPTLYVMKKYEEDLETVLKDLPEHQKNEKKNNILLVFNNLDDREKAGNVLSLAKIRYRAGKTLTPFRITGNTEWGVEVKDIHEELNNLTFWVWPESLWAPISFTKAALGKDKTEEWRNWWCSDDSTVYQFIGEDNTFFYSLAENGLFEGLKQCDPDFDIKLPVLISNCHLLYGNKKTSSSGETKPLMALDLLNHYTVDQIRAHFFALGLSLRPINFEPKPFNEAASEKDYDPVLKEGNLLCNVLNRLCRSAFYSTQKYFDGVLPHGEVSEKVLEDSQRVLLDWERNMYGNKFHKAMFGIEKYIRNFSKYWAKETNGVEDQNVIKQILIDTFHMIRTVSLILHPVAPQGTEIVKEYLKVNDDFFKWDYLFETVYHFVENPQNHKLKEIPPRFDFFKKHPSQI